MTSPAASGTAGTGVDSIIDYIINTADNSPVGSVVYFIPDPKTCGTDSCLTSPIMNRATSSTRSLAISHRNDLEADTRVR